jgi:hypothetical protein
MTFSSSLLIIATFGALVDFLHLLVRYSVIGCLIDLS